MEGIYLFFEKAGGASHWGKKTCLQYHWFWLSSDSPRLFPAPWISSMILWSWSMRQVLQKLHLVCVKLLLSGRGQRENIPSVLSHSPTKKIITKVETDRKGEKNDGACDISSRAQVPLKIHFFLLSLLTSYSSAGKALNQPCWRLGNLRYPNPLRWITNGQSLPCTFISDLR